MTAETAIYEFLREKALKSATNGDVDVQATAYQNLDREKTIRIGNAETTLAPDYDGDISEYDVDLTLQILVKVGQADDSDSFATARDEATDLAKWIISEFNNDDSLGSRVCGLNVYKALRGWAKVQAAPYAVMLLPLRVNPMSYE